MLLLPYTFAGTSIQDSNYAAYFVRGQGGVLLHAGANPVLVERQAQSPKLAYKSRNSRTIELHIKLLGTIHSQLASLQQLFDPYDLTDSGYGPGAYQLIATDSADSNKQWCVYASCIGYEELDGQDVSILLMVADPIWTTVTQTTTSKSVTASGDTVDVVTAGNRVTAPVIKLTPTAAKGVTGTDIYKRYIQVYNKAFYGVSSVNAALPFTNYPIDIPAGGFNSAALVNDTTVSNQINQVGGVTAAAGQTCPVDTAVGGGLAASGMAYCGTEQFLYTISAGTMTWVTRGIGGTTAATHADNAVIARSKSLANGADVKILVDGNPVDRWFGTSTHAWNAAATQVWININLQAMGTAAYVKLGSAIASSGAVTTIKLWGTQTATGSNYYPFGSNASYGAPPWPQSGQVLIGSEIFAYTSTDPANGNLLGCTRSILGTSNAAHAVDDQVYLLDHEISMIYGNSGATAPTTDDTRKPMFSLATSTNTSWVYTEFYDSTGPRTGAWIPQSAASSAPTATTKTKHYTTTEDIDTVTNPSAVMGLTIGAWLSGSTWKADTGNIYAVIDSPAGFTTVTVTGRKFRSTGNTSWPANSAGIWKQVNNTSPTSVWKEAAPTAGSWADLASHSAVSLSGTYTQLRWWFYGTQAARATAYCAMQASDMTLVPDTNRVPSVTLGSEIGPATGYPLNARITNENGEWLQVAYQMDEDQTLQIDCENKTITYLKDNSPANAIITFSSVREAWLNLSPGTSTLTFTDTGTTGLTWLTLTRDRASI